ncbi:hypothetical protein [Occallatibacter riparius]|uniref:Uncharacterized protein n=1 Tax=Occallatibacter riparius TaxID=1002689 RepID=A0A9J7BVX9_9BACT|nr:hypothetical protein [Occallatibacter riparius]UWZ85165.1 hypothetical protein MOP44_04285 [Occallatibacter riparius]
MQDFVDAVVAVVLLATILAFLAFAIGITPDGILYGNWPDTSDHPTNWYDTAQHPYAQ